MTVIVGSERRYALSGGRVRILYVKMSVDAGNAIGIAERSVLERVPHQIDGSLRQLMRVRSLW